MYNNVEGKPPLRANVFTVWHEATANETTDPAMQERGVFADKAASLLMKLLYAARMMRLDMCWTINTLSRFVTKWTKLCDKQLCHAYSYLQRSVDLSLHGVVDTRDADVVELMSFPDADLAGAADTTKSISGGFLHLHAEGTFVPLDWYSKKQSATAHSTTEAELISASKMLREMLIPQMELWSILLQRPVKGSIREDNEATIKVIKSGFSPQLRHLAKHHRIALSLVHELCTGEDIAVTYCPTAEQKGDLMTKGLDRVKHSAACLMVGLR